MVLLCTSSSTLTVCVTTDPEEATGANFASVIPVVGRGASGFAGGLRETSSIANKSAYKKSRDIFGKMFSY
jgi:hypothetical protein